MLGFLFGWRKASKCKKLVKLLHCRFKLLKKKINVIVKQLREDIAQFLKNGQYERAFALAEQLFKEQNLLDAYDLLGNYCEFIIIRFRYIRRHKDCPEDINEAISTLIFATACCVGIPELQVIRKLFGERYGNKFTKIAAEFHPGNLVNQEIKEKLCMQTVPDDVKLKLIMEIAEVSIFSPWQLGCNNTSKVHLLQFCGNCKDHHLEGFIFKEEACVSYNSRNSCPKKSLLSFVSEPAEHIQAECEYRPTTARPRKSSSSSCSFESCVSNNLSRASSKEKEDHGTTTIVAYLEEEVKELEFQAPHEQYGEEKRIFLFNSCIHPWRTKQVLNFPEFCNEAEKVGIAANSSIIPHQDQQLEGSAKSSYSYSHVHPKLPDYDELAMKFKALKKQHLQTKNRYRQQVLYFLENDSCF